MAYQKSKTAIKTVSPALIVPTSLAIGYGAKKLGIDIDQNRSYEIAIAVYGVVGGIINWIKHRRKA